MPLLGSPVSLSNQPPKQRSLTGISKVNLALVSWIDESGNTNNQLAVVGKNNVHLLDTRTVGFGKERVPAGRAEDWLKKEIIEAFAKLED